MKKKIFLALLLAAVMLMAVCGTETVFASALSDGAFRGGAPAGAAFTEDGSLLVCDTWNKVVWKVSGDSAALYAGVIGVPGITGEPVGAYHDDASENAYFLEPWAIVPFLDGFAVSDAGANVVRYLAGGKVYTFTGSGKAGTADGNAADAAFSHPTGLASDGNGKLYIADTGNGAIRCADEQGRVTTVVRGLESPMGLAWHDGALYIAETGRSRICRWQGGALETVAGISEAAEAVGEYIGGYADGAAARARFDHPQGIAVGADSTVYVADTGNSAVRAIRGDLVYTVARGADGAPAPVSPCGVLVSDDTLYVSDRFASDILTCSTLAKRFADVEEGAWYAEAVERMSLLGLIRGVSDTEFYPNGATSRAMIVTILWRMEGAPEASGTNPFSDVETGEWYTDAVIWAAENKIVEGYEDGTFRPAANITREQLAAILYRFAQGKGQSFQGMWSFRLDFPDAAEISDWADEAMHWMVMQGIINGKDGKLVPKGDASRAESATILCNFLFS